MTSFLQPLFAEQKYDERSFFLLAGPCVVESEQMVMDIAASIKEICSKLRIPYVFKASYRKANRSSADSFTGIGDAQALAILQQVRTRLNLPVVTDIHTAEEAAAAAPYVDILQIPAFLCRQTDLLEAAGKTGKIINIKKGQFVSGPSMKFAAEKIEKTGNSNILLTDERVGLSCCDGCNALPTTAQSIGRSNGRTTRADRNACLRCHCSRGIGFIHRDTSQSPPSQKRWRQYAAIR
jgi:2-dehydro-3-deoxyphosphooctonate aldolase (KDO 8-P synthase)